MLNAVLCFIPVQVKLVLIACHTACLLFPILCRTVISIHKSFNVSNRVFLFISRNRNNISEFRKLRNKAFFTIPCIVKLVLQIYRTWK